MGVTVLQTLVCIAASTSALAPVGPLLRCAVRDTARDEAAWDAAVERAATLPAGFRAGVTSLRFRPRELPSTEACMNVGAIVLEAPTDCVAGVYTRNRLCGAPVSAGRALLAEAAPRVQAILVNNKISNVRPGPGLGEPCAAAVGAAAARALGLADGASVVPASTGVIGWALPVDAMVAAVADLPETLRADSAADVARAMMTTDRSATPRRRLAARRGFGIAGRAGTPRRRASTSGAARRSRASSRARA